MSVQTESAIQAPLVAEPDEGSLWEVAASDAEVQEQRFRLAGGSAYQEFNSALVSQAAQSAWRPTGQSDEDREKATMFPVAAMMGLSPKDEIEGMLAAQMVATHNASMECFRRAMIPEQSAGGREMNLAQANKLTRSYATLVHALDKHRGKGQQTVRVEHVHVYDGGQAIVGNVEAGSRCASGAQPSSLAHSADRTHEWRLPVPGGSMPKNDV